MRRSLRKTIKKWRGAAPQNGQAIRSEHGTPPLRALLLTPFARHATAMSTSVSKEHLLRACDAEAEDHERVLRVHAVLCLTEDVRLWRFHYAVSCLFTTFRWQAV